MGIANASVDHGDYNVPRTDCDIPSLGGVDVGVIRAAVLPLIIQAPKRAVNEGRVICQPADGTVKVRLDVAE